MRISAIAAIGEKNELGGKNQLLWNIPEDLQHFKQLTHGHPIIMGRRTFESIGRLLPNRKNIIISRDVHYTVSGAIIAHSLNEALEEAQRDNTEEIFIIGGGELFSKALPLVTRLYLTIVHATFPQADVYFPDYSQFTKMVEKREGSSKNYLYTFLTLEK